MPAQGKDNWIRVQVSSQGDVQKLADKLKSQGMRVESVLDAIGVITGEVTEATLKKLEQTPGLTIEREGTVQLPPRDAPLQ